MIRRSHRQGAVTVEMAVCVPVLFLFVFAAIEFSRAYVILNTVENAAYEGARRGVVPGATSSDIQQTVNSILGTVGAKNANVLVTPEVVTIATPQIKVDISVPMNSNGYITPFFFKNKSLSASYTMDREWYNSTVVP